MALKENYIDGEVLNASDINDITKAVNLLTAAGYYVKPAGGVPSSDLDSTTQAALQNAENAITQVKTINGQSIEGEGDISISGGASAEELQAEGFYVKPSGGIPDTDLDDDVQQTLEKANNAITEIKTINGKSLLGKGNIRISGGEGGGSGVGEIVDGEIFFDDDANGFTIKDEEGNALLKLDQEKGIITPNLILNKLLLGVSLDSNTFKIIDKEKDALYIADSKGNIGMKLSKDGLQISGGVSGGSSSSGGGTSDSGKASWLQGKVFTSIGDSLSETGAWQRKLASLTGSTYVDMGGNKGGTQSFGITNKGGSQRAMNVVNYLKEDPLERTLDVIFIQNINDGNRIDNCLDKTAYADAHIGYAVNWDMLRTSEAYFPEYHAESDVTLTTRLGAINDFKENTASRLSGKFSVRKHGAMFQLKYGTSAKKLTFTGSPTKDGSAYITVGGNVYGINFKAGDSTDTLAGLVEAWDFPNYTDTLSGSSVIFSNTTNDPSVSFDANGSGITATVTDDSSIYYIDYLYTKYTYSDADFYNADNWTDCWNFGYFHFYKGLFEYLQRELPEVKIIFIGAPRLYLNYTNPDSAVSNADGTVSLTKFQLTTAQMLNRGLMLVQEAVSNLYGIQYLDLSKTCGITVYNMESFYPSANVHPLTAGYNRWGETIARLLTSN